MNFVRTIIHIFIVRPLLYILLGVNIVGRENLNELDNFIIYSNHNSHLDIFLIFLILPVNKINKTHPLAALDYFEKPFWLFKTVNFLFQPIWVNRNAAGCSVIKEVHEILDQKHSIIIFPEGTRGETADIKEFRRGIGLIAKKESNTPVVPIYLEGPERTFPKKFLFPLPLWNHITVSPPQILHGKSRDITTKLHKHLKILAEEEVALRQRRPVAKQKPVIIAVIGIDGSGKSTLSRHLIKYFHDECCFIGDDLELYKDGEPSSAKPLITNSLRLWVGQRAKKAKNLARYKIPKLTELLLRDRLLSEVERWYRPDLVFMDGAPLLNMVAWACLFREEYFNEEVCLKAIDVLKGGDELAKDDSIYSHFPELLALRKLNLNHLHLPDIIFFLDIKPAISIQRIHSRGEDVQAHENLEKLTKLRTAYQMVCDVLSKSHPVYRLQADTDLEQLGQEAVQFIKIIIGKKDVEN